MPAGTQLAEGAEWIGRNDAQQRQLSTAFSSKLSFRYGHGLLFRFAPILAVRTFDAALQTGPSFGKELRLLEALLELPQGCRL
jgi:hypothetical protein